MIVFGIFIGIYAYCIFIFGIFSQLFPYIINVFTFFYWLGALLYFKRSHKGAQLSHTGSFLDRPFFVFLLLLLFAQGLINFLVVLTPEYAFDAVWYHLTLPKLYLIKHAVWHIPGGLLYYSDMPKLAEMIYVGALAFGNETTAKLLQFLCGVFIVICLYKISCSIYSKKIALLTAVIFYSNIVVAWESTVAYIDLFRSVFELLAFFSFLLWTKKKNERYFFLSSILIGFAITTKLLALGSLFIFLCLLFYFLHQQKAKWYEYFKRFILYFALSLSIPLPWFIFSFIYTGNPLYPFFTSSYPTTLSFSLLNTIDFFHTVFFLFTNATDPVSPIYLIVLPLIVVYWKSFSAKEKLIAIYTILAIIVCYVGPHTGGGRFILPYLPVLSLFTGTIVFYSKKRIQTFLIIIIIVIAVATLLYRSFATVKAMPYLLGKESKQDFLTKHLNFQFGDFYDTDGYFVKHIKPTDKILLFGFHNLYYIDFPFIDETWIQKGDTFDYIATQARSIPVRFHGWREVYVNPVTHVSVYYKNGLWEEY